MTYAIFGLLLLIVGYLVRKEIFDRKAKKKERDNPTPIPQPEQQPEPLDPCRDMRDGSNFTAYMTPQECNKHGYFWCPIAKKCMPSSVNVNNCGKPPHLM